MAPTPITEYVLPDRQGAGAAVGECDAVSQALQTVAKLARAAEKGLPIGPGAVRMDEAGDFSVTNPTTASRHHFFLDGLMFHVSLTPVDDDTLFQVWAQVGYMPFTIESPEKRVRLSKILRAAAHLQNAKFTVDDKQMIMVLGQARVPGHPTLPNLMYEIVQFVQEARPYLKVLGQYL
ncbi:hypothetical protein CHU95_00715 [Niveispirillum lacus]|uniref:Uncharacterized protein n=1 Tax=Niveispirillum lacus TaxID=1981099 RepID=A0A255Z8E1_9PROT|nr:hypothetical protein [Niveispirillum lacus]OYQ37716.1 hypothetical protein CHU95_00715 [Niveispirillum lacus]